MLFLFFFYISDPHILFNVPYSSVFSYPSLSLLFLSFYLFLLFLSSLLLFRFFSPLSSNLPFSSSSRFRIAHQPGCAYFLLAPITTATRYFKRRIGSLAKDDFSSFHNSFSYFFFFLFVLSFDLFSSHSSLRLWKPFFRWRAPFLCFSLHLFF